MRYKIGDRVKHKRYGFGKITELNLRSNFAHIDLEKEYGAKTGRIKYNAIFR